MILSSKQISLFAKDMHRAQNETYRNIPNLQKQLGPMVCLCGRNEFCKKCYPPSWRRGKKEIK